MKSQCPVCRREVWTKRFILFGRPNLERRSFVHPKVSPRPIKSEIEMCERCYLEAKIRTLKI